MSSSATALSVPEDKKKRGGPPQGMIHRGERRGRREGLKYEETKNQVNRRSSHSPMSLYLLLAAPREDYAHQPQRRHFNRTHHNTNLTSSAPYCQSRSRAIIPSQVTRSLRAEPTNLFKWLGEDAAGIPLRIM
jgi:hypothetical protein